MENGSSLDFLEGHELFNQQLKEDYFTHLLKNGQVNRESVKSYARLMERLSPAEENRNKDVMHFSFEEMEDILRGFQTRFRGTIESYARIISTYLNWAVMQGYISENVLQRLNPKDFNAYVIEQDLFLTNSQLMRYEDNLENYQDAVILRLLFEGVCGRQMSELRNLKYQREFVDEETNTLKLIHSLEEDDSGRPVKYWERYLKVEDRSLHLVKRASEENYYYKSNGDMADTTGRIREYTDLIRNDYVLRPSNTKTIIMNNPIDKHVIYYRLNRISDVLGIDRLTSKFILRSGMIHFAKTIVDENQGVTLADIKIVAERFNVKSYHNLKGFLTDENLQNA
ncbi:phage lytic cycle repressor MrpR family protein [Salimicrobium halophilum]|uniref:Site-specific recombinase XerD n=1 Tax=Salimicrobium halophilum TaxID=86666 RepID=A0A1G8QWP1_9BACI|nr:hypothetical protein [Salimicrobium halophilum]SDJ08735.1 hypothetical protein SAMN04490247_0656 [Salimicrobium halophilum]